MKMAQERSASVRLAHVVRTTVGMRKEVTAANYCAEPWPRFLLSTARMIKANAASLRR